jgi:hypothetical protein
LVFALEKWENCDRMVLYYNVYSGGRKHHAEN